LRLEAYIDAAQRGSAVHILLDSGFDIPSESRSSTATCTYINGIDASESLELYCLIGNPTSNGIHSIFPISITKWCWLMPVEFCSPKI